jgi:hypothetical protein
MAGRDLLHLPATLMLHVIYSLMLEQTQELVEARERLDAKLNSLVVGRGSDGKPDRATWGKLPHQQAAMRAGMDAAE